MYLYELNVDGPSPNVTLLGLRKELLFILLLIPMSSSSKLSTNCCNDFSRICASSSFNRLSSANKFCSKKKNNGQKR